VGCCFGVPLLVGNWLDSEGLWEDLCPHVVEYDLDEPRFVFLKELESD